MSYTPVGSGASTTAPADPTQGAFGSAGFSVVTGPPHPQYDQVPGQKPLLSPDAGAPTTEDAGSYLHEQLQGMSSADLTELQKKLVKAGYLASGSVTGLPDLNTIGGYVKLLKDVSTANSLGQMLTPVQYLDKVLHDQKKAGNDKSTGVEQTSTSTDITDARTARDVAEQVFTAKLGRKPKPGELNAFYSALTSYEQANPSVTSSYTHQSGGNGNETHDTSTSTSTGGAADPSTFAGQYVDSHFGTQVGTHDALHYYGLVAQALTNPQPGVNHAA